jgi:diguanylate cyclase (GGDEF)-like protein
MSDAGVSDRDELTGLPTFSAFERVVTEELERAEVAPRRFAVMLVGIDGFEKVNDRLGPLEADAVLAEIGVRISHGIRGTDLVCRVTDDRFALGLKDTGDDDVESVYERLQVMLLRVPALTRVPMGISAGAVEYRGGNVRTLVDRAQTALDRAKASGTGWLIISVDPN